MFAVLGGPFSISDQGHMLGLPLLPSTVVHWLILRFLETLGRFQRDNHRKPEFHFEGLNPNNGHTHMNFGQHVQ